MKVKDLFVGDVILFEDPPVARTIQKVTPSEGYLVLTFEHDYQCYFKPNDHVIASRLGRVL
jgi:hypothetical protein